MALEPVVVLMEPYHAYSTALMQIYARRYGLRTVALYGGTAGLRRHGREYPSLRGPLVAASYLVDPARMAVAAAELGRRFRVEAVVPVFETDVEPLARLAEELGLSWAQPGVLERFRDKGALKQHLRSLPDGPRVNVSRYVDGPDDVLAALHDEGLARVVLKPNDGWGNQQIGYFDGATTRPELTAYFDTLGSTQVLLEEYIGGTEFYVNGQVDELGEPHVFTVTESVRIAANGRAAVCIGDYVVRTHRPEFAAAADYAREVVRGTGLRRSPFHLELKIDDEGPCLLEVAARFCGVNACVRDSEAHGGLDVLGIAAHHFLTESCYGDYPLDWVAHDSVVRGQVNGIVSVDERVHTVEGVAEVEAMPEFLRWELRPEFGNHIVPTVDLVAQPWRLSVVADDEDHYYALSERMRGTVRLNPRGSSGVRRVKELAAYAPPVTRELLSRVPSATRPAPVR